MKVAHVVLLGLGAYEVPILDDVEDPQTKEEFELLTYKSAVPITWEEYKTKYDEILMKTVVKKIRAERNIRLARTDWIMTVDNIDTLSNKNDWVAYRQALRDLPDNPPPLVWKGPELDFSKMDMPVEPPVIRIPKQS